MTWLSREPSTLEMLFVGAVFLWAYAAFVLYAWRHRADITAAVAAWFEDEEDHANAGPGSSGRVLDARPFLVTASRAGSDLSALRPVRDRVAGVVGHSEGESYRPVSPSFKTPAAKGWQRR